MLSFCNAGRSSSRTLPLLPLPNVDCSSSSRFFEKTSHFFLNKSERLRLICMHIPYNQALEGNSQ